MAGSRSSGRAEELHSQACAVASSALSTLNAVVAAKAMDGAETLERMARREARRTSLSTSEPILVLAEDATPSEVFNARMKRAVRRGKDVYLPTWTELTVGLPNIWLRSALFSAGKAERGWLDGEELFTQGDVTITYTGQALCQHDQAVYATCLDFYRTDRPLSPGGASPWVQTTYYQFSQAMGRAYGANVHRALRESLIRLNSANLRIRVSRLDVPVPRLIEVAFDDGGPQGELKGSDLIAFRVHESVANLFGPSTWTAVQKDALGYQGLHAWLAAYYSTHCKPHWVPFETLKSMSGLQCKMSDFRRLVAKSLDKLKEADTPEKLRVAAYFPETFTKDTPAVMVHMVSWRKDSAETLQGELYETL